MTQETRRDLRFSVFCAAVVLGAVALSVYMGRENLVRLTSEVFPTLLLILGALCISEYLAVALPDGPTVSLSYPLSVAAIVLFGPFWGAMVTGVSALPSLLGRERPGLVRFSVNTAQTVISAAAAGLLFVIVRLAGGSASCRERLGDIGAPAADRRGNDRHCRERPSPIGNLLAASEESAR